MLSYKKHLLEVEAALGQVRPKVSKQKPEAYIGGGNSSYRYLGLRVPQVRTVFKKAGFTFQNGLPEIETHRIWAYIWENSDIYEVACLPLMYLAETVKTGERLALLRKDLERWVNRIDNWAHSDSLSSVYARILEADRAGMLPILEKWGKSPNSWKRRQSIVSLLYYSSARKSVLPFTKLISQVEHQIDHEDYYVQKGVGWTLREIGNIYPNETFTFLKNRICELSPSAFSAATEKISKAKKTELKKLRAKAKGT